MPTDKFNLLARIENAVREDAGIAYDPREAPRPVVAAPQKNEAGL